MPPYLFNKNYLFIGIDDFFPAYLIGSHTGNLSIYSVINNNFYIDDYLNTSKKYLEGNAGNIYGLLLLKGISIAYYP